MFNAALEGLSLYQLEVYKIYVPSSNATIYNILYNKKNKKKNIADPQHQQGQATKQQLNLINVKKTWAIHLYVL